MTDATDPNMPDLLHEQQFLALVNYLAKREGHTYAELREFGDTSRDGPCQDDYDRPASTVLEALDYARVTADEVAEALRSARIIDGSTGYHLTPIKKGVYGEPSKIAEEAAEFADAVSQGASIMALVELSDLLGAIKGYLARYNLTLADLNTMSTITERAFVNGRR